MPIIHPAYFKKSLLAVSLGLVAQQSQVLAETPMLEEVVVTAQKRAQSVQDIPIAITALSGNSLSEKGIRTTQDLQLATPGLVYNENTSIAQPYIRGVGTDITTAGSEGSVATFVDGVYQVQLTGGIVAMHGIERIEVLKGPQGTLYGRNATGGAISLFTKNPGDELEGDVSIGYGNYDAVEFKGYVSIPLSDSVGFNTSVVFSDHEGYGENKVSPLLGSPIAGEDVFDEHFYSVRSKLRVDLSDATEMLLAGSYYKSDDRKNGYVTINDQGSTHAGPATIDALIGPVPGPVIIDEYGHDIVSWYDNETSHETWSVSLDFRHSFANADFRSITGYNDFSSATGIDFDTTAVPLFTFSLLEDAGTPGNGQFGETFTQEFQLSGSLDRIDWLVGAFYLKDKSGYDTINIYQGPTVTVFSGTEIETTAAAIFAHASYQVSEQVMLTAGIRYSDETKDQTKLFISQLGADIAGGEIDNDDLTYKLALNYQLNDEVMIYGKYETGFKSGVINALLPAGTPGSTVQPEEVDSFELGLKSELYNNRVRLNAAAFVYDYQNLQNQYLASDGTTLIDNAEEATIQGLEIEFSFAASEYITLDGGVSFMDSEYDKFISEGALTPSAPFPGNTPASLDVSGNDVVRVPDVIFNLGAVLDIPVSDQDSISLAVSYYYSDDHFFDITNRLKQDDYDVLNLSATYSRDGEPWSIEVWGNNVFDSEYYAIVQSFTLGDMGTPSAPARYGIRAKYEF